jgi:hypothetical protein
VRNGRLSAILEFRGGSSCCVRVAGLYGRKREEGRLSRSTCVARRPVASHAPREQRVKVEAAQQKRSGERRSYHIDDETEGRPPACVRDELRAVLPQILEAVAHEPDHDQPRVRSHRCCCADHEGEGNRDFDSDHLSPSVAHRKPDINRGDHGQGHTPDVHCIQPPQSGRGERLKDSDTNAPENDLGCERALLDHTTTKNTSDRFAKEDFRAMPRGLHDARALRVTRSGARGLELGWWREGPCIGHEAHNHLPCGARLSRPSVWLSLRGVAIRTATRAPVPSLTVGMTPHALREMCVPLRCSSFVSHRAGARGLELGWRREGPYIGHEPHNHLPCGARDARSFAVRVHRVTPSGSEGAGARVMARGAVH